MLLEMAHRRGVINIFGNFYRKGTCFHIRSQGLLGNLPFFWDSAKDVTGSEEGRRVGRALKERQRAMRKKRWEGGKLRKEVRFKEGRQRRREKR